MAHINPAFVIASSELAISAGQERLSGRFHKVGRPDKPIDPEILEPTTKCKEFRNMIRTKWKWSWLFNTVIVLILCALVVILEFDIIPFQTLGYQCNDPSLSHKFRGDTIPFAYLIAVSLAVPLITIFIVEFIVIHTTQIYRNSLKRKSFLLALNWSAQFFLGLLILLFLIQLSKSIIAEPRPHFFDTCKPDKFNCTGYVTNYKCTNKDLSERKVRDSFRSFPSGHSALGFYDAVFMAWFLQSRVPPIDYLIVPCLQCIFFSWGLVCALTRITDHRHHWWDVLVGSFVGVLMAVFTVIILCKNFQIVNSKTRKPEKIIPDTGSNSNSWYRKLFPKSGSNQQQDDRELREVK